MDMYLVCSMKCLAHVLILGFCVVQQTSAKKKNRGASRRNIQPSFFYAFEKSGACPNFLRKTHVRVCGGGRGTDFAFFLFLLA